MRGEYRPIERRQPVTTAVHPSRLSWIYSTMFIDESEAAGELQRLTRELENFQDIALQLVPLPGDVPTLEGFDIWGGSLQVSGTVGGDHITYVDFKKRFDLTARIERARAEGRLDVVRNLERCQHAGGVALIDV